MACGAIPVMKIVCCSLLFGLTILGQEQPAARSRAVQPNASPQPVESEPITPEERCTIEGGVFNSITGEPLKKPAWYYADPIRRREHRISATPEVPMRQATSQFKTSSRASII